MRYCPVCDERYDDEVIKFCTKDGTPLVDEGQPNFVILPSENEQRAERDMGDETVIRRKSPGESPLFQSESERIVIPTSQTDAQRVRQTQTRAFYPPPPPQNTAKTVVLTIIGTLVVLSFGAGLMWLFQKDPVTSINVNTNPINLNSDLNTNGFNSNFNFNFNSTPPANYASNFNLNFNFNAASKTPTNTPTPKTSPTPSPSPLFPSPSPTQRTPASPRPSLPPTPRPPAMMSNRPPANR
jgi:hypothetical protein